MLGCSLVYLCYNINMDLGSKKIYKQPEFNIVQFDFIDVIMTSCHPHKIIICPPVDLQDPEGVDDVFGVS